MSLTRKRDTTSAWVSALVICVRTGLLIQLCLAALEMYESDLDTLEQRAALQDAHLLTLREQKLAEVRNAMLVLAMLSMASYHCGYCPYTGRSLVNTRKVLLQLLYTVGLAEDCRRR